MIEHYKIPDSWAWAKLEQIAEVVDKVQPRNDPKSPFTYIDISSIDNALNKIVEPKEYTGKDAPSRARQLVKAGDILFSTVRVYLRNIALVEEKYDGQIASTGFCVIRSIPPIDPFFVFYYVMTQTVIESLSKLQRGTSYPAVRNGDVFSQAIPIPPAAEQKRIASKIDELFSRLEAGMKSLSTSKVKTEQYRSSLLRSAFRGDVTAKWRESNQYPSVQHSESAPEWLPNSWTWVTIGDVTQPSKERLDPKKHGSRKYIGLEHIQSDTGRILAIGDSKDTKSTKSVFRAGNVLYGRLRPYLNKVVVPEFDGVCSTDILVFSYASQIRSHYLAYVFMYPKFVDFVTKRMTGVQHPRIQFSTLSKYEFPLPPTKEQEIIVQFVESKTSMIRKCKQDIEMSVIRSGVLRKCILQQAFQGKLVPQDPAEGHAKELLEEFETTKGTQVRMRLK